MTGMTSTEPIIKIISLWRQLFVKMLRKIYLSIGLVVGHYRTENHDNKNVIGIKSQIFLNGVGI